MRTKLSRVPRYLVLVSFLVGLIGVQISRAQYPDQDKITNTVEYSFVAEGNEQATVYGVSETGLYIVILNEPALASYRGGVAGLAAISPELTSSRRLDASSPAALDYIDYLSEKQNQFIATVEQALGHRVEVAFNYVGALNGLAIRASHEEAREIAALPGVVAVYGDTLRELDTDVGPIHIGAPEIWDGKTGSGLATRGEGIVIGVIDSGINYLHPSFYATDGSGYIHTNPYGDGVFKGWCATHAGFCNNKLIAAYNFYTPGLSPVDTDGHGSHTASTAGGNAHVATFNVGPTPYNIPIQGVAPRANIVAYKVCNPDCPNTASIAAIDNAILYDEVDVLNFSISGSDSPWNDLVELAFLEAFNAGIFVSTSAGNSGPGASTVAHTSPWNASVAASTINRVIANTLDVTGPSAPVELQDMAAVPGESTSITADLTASIKYNSSNIDGCTAYPAGSFIDSLALIQRGGCNFDVKVANAAAAGAIGVVVSNNVGGPPISMGGLTGTPPAFMLDNVDGNALRDYIVANPTASVRVNLATRYLVNNDWEDIVAGFSSRGPSQYEILNPDYTAPGVNILAAVAAGITPAQYAFYQGTSMSSPHGAGAAALLMDLYPTMSPAEIKSALASTAVGGLVKEDGVSPADPFDVGTGLLNLAGAGKVGLVFDETYANYVSANPAIGGDPKTLNQPSLVNYNCAGTCSWTRTVKAVVDGSWTASSTAPSGVSVSIAPDKFTLSAGQSHVLTIQANVTVLPVEQWAFGWVTLTPGNTDTSATRLPVVVKKADLPPDIDVVPASLEVVQRPGTYSSQVLGIANLGGGLLNWSIATAPISTGIELTMENLDAIAAPISLIVDDGVGEIAVGLNTGGQFLWLNRFTPSPDKFPIQLERVEVMFGFPAGGSGEVNVGELIDIYLYEDSDENPANGATYRASLTGQAVQAVDGTTWSIYNLPAPISFSGPGDILIAVVNRTADVVAGTYPAVLDQSTSSQQRSWVGTDTVIGTPPVLPLSNFNLIDNVGLPGNWLVRGYGQFETACDDMSDIPWLSANPTDGTLAAGGAASITVGINTAGLTLGEHSALLCIISNDFETPLIEIPVRLEVVEGVPVDIFLPSIFR